VGAPTILATTELGMGGGLRRLCGEGLPRFIPSLDLTHWEPPTLGLPFFYCYLWQTARHAISVLEAILIDGANDIKHLFYHPCFFSGIPFVLKKDKLGRIGRLTN
jgi:hypothetical protein